MSKRQMKYWLGAALIGLLTACGGGGGGDRAAGVDPGPQAPNQPVEPPAPILPGPVGYEDAEEIFAFITAAEIDESASAFAVVTFQLTDGNNTAITDLELSNIRFTLAKLQPSPLGAGSGTWQSYVNDIETAGSVGPGTEDKLQADYERDGTLENFNDGTYRYTFATDLDNLPAEVLAQAATEGLDLSYDPSLTHRVAIQFDGAANPVNPVFDWIPATGETSGIFNYQVALTENCNRCHNPLGIHGGNRIEVEYCVTCHNPGTTDANSGNTVDMKVMIHKIHFGENLPSVIGGDPYIIWGFRDRPHDYSDIVFPQDPRNCQNCHVGTGTTNEYYPEVALSNQGDNWNEYPSRAACGSCHDDVDFDTHRGGQPDDSRCGSCHSPTSGIGPLAAHEQLIRTESQNYLPEIVSISNTGQGEFPTIEFRINNPTTGTPWNILSDAPWIETASGDSRLAVDIAWDTGDYNNDGNEDASGASAVSINPLAPGVATPTTGGAFSVTSTVAIPDGSLAPNIAANGSGGVVIEGHPAVELEAGEGLERIFMQNVNDFFSINESDGTAVPRRDVVELTECLDCHQDLVLHGSNRSNNIQSCVVCHNPRNTDRRVRPGSATDGKDEESINFSNMVHAIHSPSMRTNPLQIVGFMGFSTHVYDEDHVQFPGNLADCRECHGDDGYQLPLPSTVLGTTIDTGPLLETPTDDIVVSPAANACYACHENDVAKAHMEANGGSFSTTQADLDSGAVVEQCELCHGSGRSADVELVHGLLD